MRARLNSKPLVNISGWLNKDTVACAWLAAGIWLSVPAARSAPVPGGEAGGPLIRWSELTAKAGGAKGFVQLASGDILAAHTRRRANETSVICSRSQDGGRSWGEWAVIARAPGSQDLGDGHLVQLPDGGVLYSYRQNQTRGATNDAKTYSIRVAASRDGGKSWQPHSVVAESAAGPGQPGDAPRGLWSSFLLPRRDGTLLCFYDDEATPSREGFPGHQWLTVKTWDPIRKNWGEPVTASRAGPRPQLSREGMASVVELQSGRLLAVLESAQLERPHANLIRSVTSDDGGKTWSWSAGGRGVVFEPADRRHMAVSPWLARLHDETLVCVFATDEDRPEPDRPGAPPEEFHMDIKCVLSRDGGHSWTRPARTVFDGTHRCYAPGAAVLQDGSLLVVFSDFAARGTRALRGDLPRE